jgi:hypothetical protein
MADTQEPAKAPTPPAPPPPPSPPAPPPAVPPAVPPAAPVNQPAKAAAPPVDGPQKAPQSPPPPPTGQAELDAKVSHQQAVDEGVKAAASIRQTTQEAVLADRAPVKAPAPHPFVGKMTQLMNEVADMAKSHKEDVLDLRDRLQRLLFDVPADMPGHSLSSVHSVATQIEEGINMLDPDVSARSPG